MIETGLVAFALFVGILALGVLGHRLGARRIEALGDDARAGLGAIEGAVFALMGLLVAFTFSGAANRFDARRDLVVQESNAIGTAWLRIDLLPADAQPALRDAFRRYVDQRLEIYRTLDDEAAARSAIARAEATQGVIWSLALAAVPTAPLPQAATLVVPALNEMIDISATRGMALHLHPPRVVYAMLFGVVLASALLAGYAMAESRAPSRLHLVGFALIVALSVYVILDLEHPRRGLIRVDAADQMLVDLRASMD